MKKIIKAIFLGAFLHSANAAQPALEVETMDTGTLFDKTIDTLYECIEYCIDGLSLYMIWTPWGVDWYLTPNVSHNSPDILMLTHNELDKTPYEDFNSSFGETYKNTAESIMQGITGLEEVEIGGGRERHKKWGHHQSVAFKEATAFGHPAAIIMKMFDQGGVKQTDGNGNIVDSDGNITDSSNVNYTSGGQDNSNGFLEGVSSLSSQSGNSFGQSTEETQANMDKVSSNEGLGETMSSISDGMNAVAGDASTGQRLFCPSSITPLMPYYLSGLDAVQWRMGYPTTDSKYSRYILNPLSNDSIGTEVKDEFSLKYGESEYGFSLPKTYEEWGNMFPREGVLNHDWDSKRGTVIAARAAHILVENQSARVRYKPDPSNNGFGGWGKVFPVVGETTPGQTAAACHKNVANTGITNNMTGGYGWTFWRRYNCDLRTDYIYVTTFKFPEPICITPKVPD